jgi:NhaP-type Na+/H+ or K+/H+ antiporter
MLATGFTIFLGVTLLLTKLPRRTALRILKYDLALDLMVSAAVLIIHFGTFSGVMAATVAGLLMSLATSGMKRLVGYVDGNFYVPGRIRLDV